MFHQTENEIDQDQDWLFHVNCLGPFASDEDIAQAINDAPDADHPEVAYLQATLDARFIEAKKAA